MTEIDLKNEIWVPVYDKKFKDHYEVSNMGRVARIKFGRERSILKLKIDDGYNRIELSNKISKMFSIQRLVYFSFNPYEDFTLQINHINFIKTDNRLENLEAISSSNNIRHTFQKGKHRSQKIHPDEYNKIAKLNEDGIKNKEIGNLYGVHKCTISNILNKMGIYQTNRPKLNKPEKKLIEHIDEYGILWKPIIIDNIKCPYYISSTGKIKTSKYKLITTRINKSGYEIHSIRKYYKISSFVHRLVAQLFISNPENKLVVNHIDGNKLNNCVSNLEWVTSSENSSHYYNMGQAKLQKIHTPEYSNILDLHNKGIPYKQIADIYKVSVHTISKILNNKLGIIKQKTYSIEDHKKIKELYDQKYSVSEIRQMLNIHKSVIYRSLKSNKTN